MNRKIALAALCLALSAAPALARDCKADPILNGAFTRGSAKCNPDWLNRRATLLMLRLTEQCQAMGAPNLTALTLLGMNGFDKKAKALGQEKTCMMLDADMIQIENEFSKSMRRLLR